MKILLIGPLGSGKGTQGEMLSKHLNIPSISIGAALRALPTTSPYYEQVQSDLKAGKLASVDIAGEILKEETAKPEYKNGFIFDGWGRRLADLQKFDPGFDKVFYINISMQESIRRLSARWTCENCGKIYNTITMPPKVAGVCDVCRGKLVQREDDKEEAIKKRLEIFNTETKEVIDYFKKQGSLIEINGEQSPESVSKDIMASI
jgi:adenylate kinase